MLKCDECYYRGKCHAEGRLITFTTLEDTQYDREYGGKASHGMLNIGETCPKERSESDDEIAHAEYAWRK